MIVPELSVIICCYNPDARRLAWVLDGLAAQTMDRSRFEVIVVDNGSSPALEIDNERGLQMRIVPEPRNGLSFARSRGIEEARGALLAFVDDDNRLAADYLATALAIAAREPELGAIGGIASPVFEQPPRDWQLPLLEALGVRDCGPDAVTAVSQDWGAWLPIGAGMVCRRQIAERYREYVLANGAAQALGRSAGSFVSGDDTLLARTAVQMGYACSYQPRLRLQHYVAASRLRFANLARTMYGHGRAFAILEHLRHEPIRSENLVLKLARRVWAGGRSGVLHWIWDCGVAVESGRIRRARRPDIS